MKISFESAVEECMIPGMTSFCLALACPHGRSDQNGFQKLIGICFGRDVLLNIIVTNREENDLCPWLVAMAVLF